jgi:hypothetical protein
MLSRRALSLSRVHLFSCVRKLLIEFAIADRRDQGVDHGWQLVE